MQKKDSIVLPKEYGWVLASVTATSLHCFLSAIHPAVARRNVFDSKFMGQFKDDHQATFGADAPSGGYPDMGSGRYSAKLDYKNWFYFNSAQRIHYNFVEGLTPALIFQLVGGLKYPVQSAIIGACYNLGRVAYAVGYRLSPNLRGPGAIVVDLCLLGGLVLSVLSLLDIIRK
jgi:glutathione S-transferase